MARSVIASFVSLVATHGKTMASSAASVTNFHSGHRRRGRHIMRTGQFQLRSLADCKSYKAEVTGSSSVVNCSQRISFYA